MPSDRDPTARILGTWYHSHEEDSPTRARYRPEGFPFPRSRGRFGVILEEGGRARVLGPAPDDRAMAGPATWEVDGDRVRVEHEGGVLEFEIVRSEGDEVLLEIPRGD